MDSVGEDPRLSLLFRLSLAARPLGERAVVTATSKAVLVTVSRA